MCIKWNLGEVPNNQIYNVNNKKKILCFSHRQMMKKHHSLWKKWNLDQFIAVTQARKTNQGIDMTNTVYNSGRRTLQA